MTTQTAQPNVWGAPIPRTSPERRAMLRYARGLIDSAEALRLASVAPITERPLTDAEWRYIGQCNGITY